MPSVGICGDFSTTIRNSPLLSPLPLLSLLPLLCSFCLYFLGVILSAAKDLGFALAFPRKIPPFVKSYLHGKTESCRNRRTRKRGSQLRLCSFVPRLGI